MNPGDIHMKEPGVLRRLWDGLVTAGTTDNNSTTIRLTNIIALFHALISIPYGLYFKVIGYDLIAIMVGPIVFCYLLTLVFNKLGYYTFAKTYLIIISHLTVLFYALQFGNSSGLQYLFLVFFCLPFLLFHSYQYWHIYFTLLFSFIVFFSFHYNLFGYTPLVGSDIQQKIYISMIFFIYAVLGMYCVSFVKLNNRKQEEITALKEQYETEVNEVRGTLLEDTKSEASNLAEIVNEQQRKLQLARNLVLQEKETRKQLLSSKAKELETIQKELEQKVNLQKKEIEDLYAQLRDHKNKATAPADEEEIKNKNKELNEKLGFLNSENAVYHQAIIYHIKEPLHSLISMSKWIREDHGQQLNEAGLEKLNLLDQNIEKINRVVNNLTRYKNLFTFNETKVWVDLEQVINSIIKKRGTGENIEIEKNELPTVFAGKLAINEIFSVLLDNLIRANNKNLKKISINAEKIEHSWKIIISDNYLELGATEGEQKIDFSGNVKIPGIPGEFVSGLAIVKRLMEINEASVWLEAGKNRACNLIFVFPNHKE